VLLLVLWLDLPHPAVGVSPLPIMLQLVLFAALSLHCRPAAELMSYSHNVFAISTLFTFSSQSDAYKTQEQTSRVSQDCSVLDVIPPAAQDVPVPQQLLLTLFSWPLNALMFPTPYAGPSVTFLMTMLSVPVTFFT